MQWEARYNDGTTLPQYNADGSENSYHNIDRSKLQSFALFTDGRGRLVFELHLDPGQRLIFRRRIRKLIGEENGYITYLIGWQQTINGTNVQSIAYLTEMGELHIAGAWKEDHPWFYSVVPIECENG